MDIAVLGTGVVGQTLAGRLAELDHHVTVGTRDPEATAARTEQPRMGEPMAEWLAAHPEVRLATFADAVADAELVVNATEGHASLDALGSAGADRLAGKVLLDVANALDFSAGFPPTLFVKDTDSLAEQIQRAFPESRVVKSLNTMNATVMVHPEAVGGGDHSVFVSGDDPGAKETVTALLTELGHTDVIDLGGLATARGAEMWMPLWLSVMGSLGTASFNLKIVR